MLQPPSKRPCKNIPFMRNGTFFYMNHICINKKRTDKHLKFNNINKTASQSIFHYNKD